MTQRLKKLLDNKYSRTLAIVLPLLFVYYRTLNYGFSPMDEQWMIVKSTNFLKHWSSLSDCFFKPLTNLYYRPLFTISLIIDYHLGKLSPNIYHFTNIIWHCLSVFTLFNFLLAFQLKKISAYVLSILFSIHPILLHAVAWIPGRNDIMLSVFVLSSIISLKKYISNLESRHLILHTLWFVCALLTKESAIVLPLIYGVCILFFSKLDTKRRRQLIGIYGLLTCFWLFARNSALSDHTAFSIPNTNQINAMLVGLLFYIGKTIYPFHQSVFPTIAHSSLLPGFLSLVVITVLCFFIGLKDKKIAAFGLVLFLALLVVPLWYSATLGTGEQYEQRLYGSMAGLILFLSQIKFKQNSNVLSFVLFSLGLLYVSKTIARIPVYKTQENFIDAGIVEAPSYYLFPLQKADLLNTRNELDSAIAYYSRALILRPNLAETYNNRAWAYYKMQQYDMAIDDYSSAIKLSESNHNYFKGRCMANFQANKIRSAMKDFLVLKKCCAEMISADFENKITTRFTNEIESLQKQIKLRPSDAKLYFELAQLYQDIEMKTEANLCFKKAAELDPKYSTVTANRAKNQ